MCRYPPTPVNPHRNVWASSSKCPGPPRSRVGLPRPRQQGARTDIEMASLWRTAMRQKTQACRCSRQVTRPPSLLAWSSSPCSQPLTPLLPRESCSDGQVTIGIQTISISISRSSTYENSRALATGKSSFSKRMDAHRPSDSRRGTQPVELGRVCARVAAVYDCPLCLLGRVVDPLPHRIHHLVLEPLLNLTHVHLRSGVKKSFHDSRRDPAQARLACEHPQARQNLPNPDT